MQDIVSTLKTLISPEENSTTFDDIYKEESNEESNSSEKYNPIPKSSKGIIDINENLSIGSDIFVNTKFESNSSSRQVSAVQSKMSGKVIYYNNTFRIINLN